MCQILDDGKLLKLEKALGLPKYRGLMEKRLCFLDIRYAAISSFAICNSFIYFLINHCIWTHRSGFVKKMDINKREKK